MNDNFNLQRFVDAQAPVYERVRDELRTGRKSSHWMWFIFPQLRDLGRSPTAEYFGIGSLAEAVAYQRHALLGPRLAECTNLVLAVDGSTAHEIFGSPDDLKFCSCMTLFEQAAPDETVFREAIDRYFHGTPDGITLTLLSESR